MEPRTPSISPSPEMGAYRAPETQISSQQGEVIKHTPEQAPHTPEAKPATAPAPVQALPKLPSLPSPQPAPMPTKVKDSNPLSAADEDVIEKEWVDKAKKIVTQTKDNPYLQEKEVSRLQADYLKKRYGKEIKLNSGE